MYKKRTKIDERLPQDIGKKCYPSYGGIRSPWGKIANIREINEYLNRYESVVAGLALQAIRIVIPDYITRATLMCETFQQVLKTRFGGGPDPTTGMSVADMFNLHPFFRGNFMGAFVPDPEDNYEMPGRVNDFGTYRVEKELDKCPWAICGSELCRATGSVLQIIFDEVGKNRPDGPRLEANMVEAIGCGDLHCRVVGESRELWPLPESENKPVWESLGPYATEHLIKCTPKEDFVTEPCFFRNDCNFIYASGTNLEIDETHLLNAFAPPLAPFALYPAILAGIAKGMYTEEAYKNAQNCVCEAAGKAAFGEFFAKKGLCDWLGIPEEVGTKDGRCLGGYIEMYLQGRLIPYEIEAFNKEEVVYVIDRGLLGAGTELYVNALVTYWYGMCKTLVDPRWALWEEDSPEGKLRIIISPKKDRFC